MQIHLQCFDDQMILLFIDEQTAQLQGAGSHRYAYFGRLTRVHKMGPIKDTRALMRTYPCFNFLLQLLYQLFISMKRVYDHEQSHEEQEQEEQSNHSQLRILQDEYNFAKLTADINQLQLQNKTHDQSIRHLQKEVQGRVTEHQLSEAIALINAGIQTDPNLIKLLKSRENNELSEKSKDKTKINALAFSKKLNQMSESLSVLLMSIRRVETRVQSIEADLTSQLNQRLGAQQIQLQEARADQVKETMQLQQKMQIMSFELGDKLRDIETKTSWRLNEFKSKIDEKISEQFVVTYLQNTQKKMDKSMREYQLTSNISPERVEAIEREIKNNQELAVSGLTKCQYKITAIQNEIDTTLMKEEAYKEDKYKIQQRLNLFNANFIDVYQRVKTSQDLEKVMDANISQLLKDTKSAFEEVKRINTVLTNLKIGQDFQKMLEEMNPTKVLQLQNRVDDVNNAQTGIWRQIDFAKREIDKIKAKADVLGVMAPNKLRDQFRKEQLQEAMNEYLSDHHFIQKMANLDRQLAHYKLSIDSINLLTRQVARIQKEDESHKLALQMTVLQQNVKKQLMLLHNKLKERSWPTNMNMQRLTSKVGSNVNGELVPMGQALNSRSFSVKKMGKVSSLYQNSMQVYSGTKEKK